MADDIPDHTQFDSLRKALDDAARRVGTTLDEVLPAPEGLYARVPEAMRYAVFAGGKRLRPFLTLAGAALFDAPEAQALRVAAAIECLHTYSLIHDDLPCMDDDDLRRGRPTSHKVYGEGIAVLAGDGLLTVAFEILSKAEPTARFKTHALISELATASGSKWLIGGQVADLEGEG
ncbi:MAG TPA: polyprenyl synthetase family protein, partial [Caulobacteraceae bacterium]|nr:polyprenyl synthetase family protein [Caulobacteraceae bacterium]